MQTPSHKVALHSESITMVRARSTLSLHKNTTILGCVFPHATLCARGKRLQKVARWSTESPWMRIACLCRSVP
jgi:hypothetical protein